MRRTYSRTVWALWGVSLVVAAGALVLALLNAPIETGGMLLVYALLALIVATSATAGALIVSRAGGNPIGWVMMGMGVSLGLGAFSEQYLLRGYVLAPGSLPLLSAVGWLTAWTRGERDGGSTPRLRTMSGVCGAVR